MLPKLLPSKIHEGALFGRAVALLGNTAMIGARGDNDTGSAYVFQRKGKVWVQAKNPITPPLRNNSDNSDNIGATFGNAISLWGDTALIGAPGIPVGPKEFRHGKAYIYRRERDRWLLDIELSSGYGGPFGDHFGACVALRGNTALIGAQDARPIGELADGLAYIFERTNGQWHKTVLGRPGNDGMGPGAGFGISVALSADVAMVGAWNETVNGRTGAGAAYTFRRKGVGQWKFENRIVLPLPIENDLFGRTVAIEDRTALVGAYWRNEKRGAVYVLENDGSGNWTFKEELPLPPPVLAKGDFFGVSVALAGEHAVVGAFQGNEVDCLVSGGSGKVYVFKKTKAGWTQRAVVGEWRCDGFGISVAIADRTVLIGAFRYDGYNSGIQTDSGAVYVMQID